MDAQDFVVANAIPKIVYIPNFISEDEEQFLLEKIYSAPKPKWENLSNRRLQQWGGVVGKKCLVADNHMPEWLTTYISRICAIKNGFPADRTPNHVLINEYLPGQGIMPHTDGPAFFPLVSTISLGSQTLLKFYEHHEGMSGRTLLGAMLLQPRSLIMISERAYSDCLHGIDDFDFDVIDEKVFNRPEDVRLGVLMSRSTRVSLTIRNVPIVNRSLFGKIFK